MHPRPTYTSRKADYSLRLHRYRLIESFTAHVDELLQIGNELEYSYRSGITSGEPSFPSASGNAVTKIRAYELLPLAILAEPVHLASCEGDC
jgi:hypothetical protein